MTRKQRHDIKRKLDVFNYAKNIGNINKACRHYGISKTTYFNWLKRYQKDGEQGLINNKPCPENIKMRTPIEVEEKVLHLRKKYHFGPERIYMYLKRYLNIHTSETSVYRILKRNGIT